MPPAPVHLVSIYYEALFTEVPHEPSVYLTSCSESRAIRNRYSMTAPYCRARVTESRGVTRSVSDSLHARRIRSIGFTASRNKSSRLLGSFAMELKAIVWSCWSVAVQQANQKLKHVAAKTYFGGKDRKIQQDR